MGFSEIKIGGVVLFGTPGMSISLPITMKSKSSHNRLPLLLSCFDIFINKPVRIRPFVPMDDR